MLDEMFQRNASKFAILFEYKNPCLIYMHLFSKSDFIQTEGGGHNLFTVETKAQSGGRLVNVCVNCECMHVNACNSIGRAELRGTATRVYRKTG